MNESRFFLRDDCNFYRGDRPCGKNRLCDGCDDYEPSGKRILIIKLGAAGDVLRTACLADGLKKAAFPCRIDWVTEKNAIPLLEGHPHIDRIAPFNWRTALALEGRSFDLAICLDKEPEATALMAKIGAERKMGFGMSGAGTPIPLNAEADYLFLLGLSDEEKFRKNRKSYPQLIFEACGLEYAGEKYTLHLTDREKEDGAAALKASGLEGNGPVVGLNTGAGERFANKNLSPEQYVELIRAVRNSGFCRPVLLGGPDELEKNPAIQKALESPICDAGTGNSLRRFCAIVNACDLIVTGDTLCLHIAVALGKPVVAFFGPTCEQEIDLFGAGIKLVSKIECSPCYKSACSLSPNCMDEFSTDRIIEALQSALPR